MKSQYSLSPNELAALQDIRTQLNPSDQLKILEGLRQERALEHAIYTSREQRLWVPWTICLSGSVLSIAASQIFWVYAGIPIVLGILAFWIAVKSKQGILYSIDAITKRHEWTHNLTESNQYFMAPFSFSFRRGQHDVVHHRGFSYSTSVWWWTIVIWGFLAFIVFMRARLSHEAIGWEFPWLTFADSSCSR
jgi:hypothetical protein